MLFPSVPTTRPTRPDPALVRARIAGALWGHLCSDAKGVPYEFGSRRPQRVAEDVPPPPAGRAWPSVPVGTWSDDGALTLATVEQLAMSIAGVQASGLVERFLRWRDRGDFTPDGHVFDIGGQTARALYHWTVEQARFATGHGYMPVHPARNIGSDAGNGALMRVAPVALLPWKDDVELVRQVLAAALVTHGAPESSAACVAYALWLSRLVAYPTVPTAESDVWEVPWDAAASAMLSLRLQAARTNEGDLVTFGGVLLPGGAWARALDVSELVAIEVALQELRDAVRAGRGACNPTPFVRDTFVHVVQGVLSAVRRGRSGALPYYVAGVCTRGGDTDTIAAIGGAVIGAGWGIESVPVAWRDQLRGKSTVIDIVTALQLRAVEQLRALDSTP